MLSGIVDVEGTKKLRYWDTVPYTFTDITVHAYLIYLRDKLRGSPCLILYMISRILET